MRIGARLPTSGHGLDRDSLLGGAIALEAAGADSLWVSDHVLQPAKIDSSYPYSADGSVTWDSTVPYYEAIAVLGAVAAVTSRIELGTAVLVLPQRQPVVLAKQLATIDVIAGGRLALGVGAGWMAQEFAALGADFVGRGRVMNEWISVLRECWTGEPPARETPDYTMPAGMITRPVPTRPIPILVGGMSGAALRRVIALGDGWIAQAECTPVGAEEVVATYAALCAGWLIAGREPGSLRSVVRLSGEATSLDDVLPMLGAAGIQEVVLSLPADGDVAGLMARARAAL